jgi:hypothetical protein
MVQVRILAAERIVRSLIQPERKLVGELEAGRER